MKIRTLSFFLFMFIAHSAWCLTDAERAIVKHVQQLNIRQKAELEDTRAKLVWTHKELTDLQPKIDQVGKERDDFKYLYEKDHEANLKRKAHILKLYIVIGLMTLAMAGYAFAKFYLRVPFL
jgi:hypothetical protein